MDMQFLPLGTKVRLGERQVHDWLEVPGGMCSRPSKWQPFSSLHPQHLGWDMAYNRVLVSAYPSHQGMRVRLSRGGKPSCSGTKEWGSTDHRWYPTIQEVDFQASLFQCPGPEAKCTNFVEPVALDSILETATAFWLCNVQSQPWPASLGCLSLVMRPVYVFRLPRGEKSGRRWGTSKSNNNPLNPLCNLWQLVKECQSILDQSRGSENTFACLLWNNPHYETLHSRQSAGRH